MFELVNKVLAEQAPNGAFYATVLHHGKRFLDANGRFTCLIISELEKLPQEEPIAEAIERGLEYLIRCRRKADASLFNFYPEGEVPKWAKNQNASRTDDTALAALTLHRHGMMSSVDLEEVVIALDEHRLVTRPDNAQPWIYPGAYQTWLDSRICPNPVDCCVNANIATFLRATGRDDHPGYRSATATVVAGVCEAMEKPMLTKFLSPYHPDPNELLQAMRRAVVVGVTEFESLVEEAGTRLKPWRRNAGLAPVLGNNNNQTLWFSHGLQMARTAGRLHAEEMAWIA